MFSSIFLGNIGGGSGNSGSIFLQPQGGGPISATPQVITDSAGNNTGLLLSSSAVLVGSGTITQNGALTVKGAGGNIVSLRDAANVEVANITNGGAVVAASATFNSNGFIIMAGRATIDSPGAGILRLSNIAGTDLSRLVLGSNDNSGISLVKSSTEMRAMLGNAGAYAAFRSLTIQTEDMTTGTLTTARPVRFGDRATITEAAYLSMNLTRQIAIEHNGVAYYIPASLTQIP